MTLRCLIIDDEPLAHRIILKYAENLSDLEIVGQCYLATEALPLLSGEEVDLIFLDINMPVLKGLDFLRTLRHPPLVVVTSAYEEFALESYELDVVDYLHKPFRFERFLSAVDRVRQRIPPTPSKASGDTDEKTHLFVKSDKRTVSIVLKEITHLESYGNYVKIWSGGEFVLTPSTLTNLTEQLPAGDFLRIHKSFTVNWRAIDFTEGNVVRLSSGTEIMVGKNYRALLKAFLR